MGPGDGSVTHSIYAGFRVALQVRAYVPQKTVGYKRLWVRSLTQIWGLKIKLIVKMAYGFRNVENLFSMVMLKCSNLRVALPGRPPLETHTS